MNKIKTMIVCLLIFVLGVITFTFLRIKNKEGFQQKVVLAQELRKVLEPLAFDLREAREDTIQGVPADGIWHNRIAFIQSQLGGMEYVVKGGRLFRINQGKILMVADNIDDLRIRRHKETPDVVEVRIEAKKNVTLISNLKIRIRQ